MTGTAIAERVIEECGEKGVRSVVMLTAGFRETGAEGAALEERLVRRADELGITMLGPNCLGFVNYAERVAAYGLLLQTRLPAGPVAIASQSGATLLHFHRLAHARGAGLARLVSIGNEAMVSAADVIADFLDSPDVRVIGALLEGFRNPQRFLEVAERALEAAKPLVVLKVGRSAVAGRAVAAHTGSLAGEDRVVDAVLRQKGVIRVHSLEELLETCTALAEHGWPEGRRTAVITTSGGACGLVSDHAHGTRLDLADFAAPTKQRLAEILPDFGTPQNPLDTTGVIVNQPGLLAACVEAVVAERSYDAFLINTDPPRDPGLVPGRVEQRMDALVGALQKIPVFWTLSSTAPVDLTDFGRQTLLRHGLYCHSGLGLGVKAVDGAIRYGEVHARRRPRPAYEPMQVPLAGIRSGPLNELESKRLLQARGIMAVEERAVGSAAEAMEVAATVGLPCVVKVLSADIPHKSDAGGVRTGLRTAEEVGVAFREVIDAARRAHPDARIDGALVAHQVDTAVAELLAGVTVDPVFGPVVAVGLGGVFTEVFDDVSLRLPPLDHQEATAMLMELRAAPLLRGARGRPPADIDDAAAAVVRLGELALDLGNSLEAIDVNPLFVMPAGGGALAGDALVVLK